MRFPLSNRNSFFVGFLGLVLPLVLLCSCGTTRPYVYMQGSFDTATLSKINAADPVFQKGDLISIVVYSDNPVATQIYNQQLITVSSGAGSAAGESSGLAGSSPTAPGYLIDENGNIEFQGLGLLHIEGLTRAGLKTLLDSKLKDTLLKNPYYNIRFLNNRFTMLGEINHPGIFSIPSDHINLLEALSLAGDMTQYGRRDNVLVMREQNGVRQWARLDVTKPDIMASPYFYLQQNDIVYVEQNRKKSAANDQLTMRNISIATSLVSVVAILFTVFKL
ncbi:MAG: polysaccharide biosynthesis/export family protein [Bacteroidetes bacterium]|nr:polysaccharide biosynthesis/export family protein [Bacteroidota bacterium]